MKERIFDVRERVGRRSDECDSPNAPWQIACNVCGLKDYL